MAEQISSMGKLADNLGYELLPLYGCGVYGCAFGVKHKQTGVIAALKLTRDEKEAFCVARLFEKEIWHKTNHLPVIYSFGGPILLTDPVIDKWGVSKFTKKTKIYYYIREELSDVPKEFYKSPWALTKDAKKAQDKIEKLTGLCLPDAHMENWGFRAAELEKFSTGKSKKIPTYVLRDLSCTSCVIQSEGTPDDKTRTA